jgi:hypothetical protein
MLNLNEMSVAVLWAMTSLTIVCGYQRFRGIFHLYLHDVTQVGKLEDYNKDMWWVAGIGQGRTE